MLFGCSLKFLRFDWFRAYEAQVRVQARAAPYKRKQTAHQYQPQNEGTRPQITFTLFAGYSKYHRGPREVMVQKAQRIAALPGGQYSQGEKWIVAGCICHLGEFRVRVHRPGCWSRHPLLAALDESLTLPCQRQCTSHDESTGTGFAPILDHKK